MSVVLELVHAVTPLFCQILIKFCFKVSSSSLAEKENIASNNVNCFENVTGTGMSSIKQTFTVLENVFLVFRHSRAIFLFRLPLISFLYTALGLKFGTPGSLELDAEGKNLPTCFARLGVLNMRLA